MAISTASDIVKKSLQKLGILAEGETGSAQQMNDGLDALNIMLSSWAARGLLTSAQIEEAFPLTAGTYIYTIGTSVVAPNFITSKLFQINSAFIRDGNGNDTPVNIITREEYNLFELKTDAGVPRNLFYDPGPTQQTAQIGTIYLYFVPDDTIAYTLVIASEKPFTEFTDLSDAITFPTYYNKALINNLSIEIASEYGISVSAEVVKAAHDSLEIIETINSSNKTLVMDTGLPTNYRIGNILTGE